MKIAKIIPLDLAARGAAIQIGEAAVAGDSGVRELIFELQENGAPWSPPEGVRASLAFRTEHGSMGEYDTMPDGTDAALISGNRVTVRLVDAVLAQAGTVWLGLILRDSGMNRLSAFPLLMTVSQGLIDVGELPQQYFHIRDLEQVNAVIAELRARVAAVDTEENRAASEAAKTAAEEARRHAESLDAAKIAADIAAKGDTQRIDPETGDLCLMSGDKELSRVPLPDDGVGFERWAYDQETMKLHLYDADGEDVIEPVYIPGGGGGGNYGSRLTVAMVTAASVVAAESADKVELAFSFSSMDAATGTATGNGTLQLTVGGVVKRTTEITQGDVKLNIRPWLSAGANAVVLTVTDAYGATATRRISVTLETLTLQWSLGATEKAEGSLSLTLTPIGNYTKTVYLAVDGEELESFEVSTSGRQTTKTIPVQTHGGHRVTAWATMEVVGTTMTSDVLQCAVAWVSEDTPAIACVDVPEEATQFTTVNLVHRVVDPGSNPATVQYLVNGEVFRETEVDQSEQIWSYRLSSEGETTLSILCGDVRHDEVIQVAGIGVNVEEITDGLDLKIDPATMSDLVSWESGGYSFTLSDGFDLVNGGLQNDADGVRCIRVTAGDRLTLNYPLFSGDARKNGLSAKLIYAVRDSSAKHCTAISCLDGTVGLEVQANNVYLRGNQTSCKLSTCEDERTELDLNIQPDSMDGIMYLWEGCSTFSYMKYATDESFVHTAGTGITFGCDDADVYLYLFRAYPSRSLTCEELKANFIADGKDAEQILDRQSRNDIYDSTGSIDIEKCASRNPDCHHIVISAERMTKGKKDEVKGTIRHIFKSGGPEHQFTADVSMFVQGTSSVEHAETAGPNLNFYFPGGVTLADGTVMADGYAMNGRDKSVPVLELCYKKNIASEDHIVNRMSAEWYNRFQPSLRRERVDNPLVRDCLDSTMCAVYFHNTGKEAVQVGPDLVPPGATIFFGLGNLVSNKDSVDAFAYHPIVIEVKNNTEPQVRFKSADLSGDNWGNNYEFRYLDTTQYTENHAKAEWQKVQNFLYQTDCTAATDNTLTEAVTINGVTYATDSVAYRKARWDAESPVIFDKKTLTWHHNITLFLLLRDNRAKNMFWSYDPDTGKWGLWFNWDNDTGLCRNNDGYIDIEPGYMDFDSLGTGDCFNGADNVLFVNLRTWDAALLESDYLDRESAGAWNIDGLYAYAMDSQESICEALWIEDAQHNAIRTMQNLGTSAYLERATGRLRLHLKKALTFQKVLVDSWYCSVDAKTQRTKFRGYKPSEWAGVEPHGNLSVTTYTNMYVNILAGSTAYKVRATEGVPVAVNISASLNNTEMYFYHAPWIQSFGDMSGLYLGQFEALHLRRVRELLIGSDNTAYYNTNFTQADFDNCVKLERLNLGGLQNAKRSFDFRNNLYLKELYTGGSGITGLTFARNGRLETARLNAVGSLNMDSLHKLATFRVPSYANLTSLSIENCPALDTCAMVTEAQGLKNVRLTDVDWVCDDAAVLMRLISCGGLDDDGYPATQPVLTGKAHVAKATQEQIDAITAAFPALELTYDSIVPSYTVTFCNYDGTVLNTQRVREDGYALNPITVGLIDTPTKPSDVEFHYTYAGWDKSLQNILEDTVITAVYTESDRYYRVSWWSDGTESTLLQEDTVIAHGSSVYAGADPEQEGKFWTGWDAEAPDVVCDMDIHATYVTPVMPEVVVEQYDFLYSDDPEDNSAYSLAEFIGILESGAAKTYFQVGDRIKMVTPTDVFVDSTIELSVHGFNHYVMADGSGQFAGVVFGMVGVMNAGHAMNSTATTEGGWPATKMRTFLNETVYTALPQQWKALIRKVKVLSSAGNTSADIVTSEDYLFLFSSAELGFYCDEAPYCDEVAAGAEEMTFGCYTNDESRIKKTYNGTGGAQYYYLRSPYAASGWQTSMVATSGAVGISRTQDSRYVAFGFCLGGALV